MNRKNISILLIAALLSFSMMTCVYGADFNSLQVTVEQQELKIEFTAAEVGTNQQAAILIVDKGILVEDKLPEEIDENKIFHIDQMTPVVNGVNSIAIKVPDHMPSGDYRVYIGGDNGVQVQYADFSYETETPPVSPSPSVSASPVPSPSTSPSPAVSPTISPSDTPSYGGGGGGGGGSRPSPTVSPSPSVTPSQSPDASISPEPSAPVLTDIIGHWAELEIKDLAAKGIVKGVTDTEYLPEKEVTRAEFASLIRRALNLPLAEYNAQFADVSQKDWYAGEIASIVNAGIMQGASGYFRPNDSITREEMAKVVVEAHETLNGEIVPGKIQFSDADKISGWAAEYIEKAVSAGLMKGMDETTFAPREYSTRAQAAVVIWRIL